MHLKPFDYYRPASLAELAEIMDAREAGGFALMGGGTDVLVKMKQRLPLPATVISLSGIPEMTKLENRGRDLFIGITLNRLEESAPVLSHFPALSQAAGSVGSPQLRNMGTIGGNIFLDTRCLYFNQPQWPGAFSPCYKRGGDLCHVVKGGKRCWALFCADTPAALLAYEARLLISGPDGEREAPIAEFYRDDGLSCRLIGAKELLLGIKLPLRPENAGCYLRFSTRSAIDFPLAGVAVVMEKASTALNCRVAATGIQSRPVRLIKMEEVLAGGIRARKITEGGFSEGMKDMRLVRHQGVSPPYRREIVKVLVERALERLIG
jgi:4-hydroxybenzoyl-CoA reductase subunit beta